MRPSTWLGTVSLSNRGEGAACYGKGGHSTLASGIKTEVYRFIPELSYATAAPVRSTN